MKLTPHPGYEALWGLKMDINGKKDGRETDFDQKLKELRKDFQIPATLEVNDISIPGLNQAPKVPIRIYQDPEAQNAAILINIHGGGFVSGDLDQDDHRAASFAEHVPCTVVSVDYRLAPQTVFPGALEDCYAVLLWVFNHAGDIGADPQRIAVFGTSAGGAIAASLCLYVRDNGGPKISLQILNFATLDYSADSLSCHQFFQGTPLIEGKGISKAWQLYLGGFDGQTPSYFAVPSLARDLSDLPPACVITCEYDPLRDQGIDYARRLMTFAVPTELYSLPRVPHGFDLIRAPMTTWVREGQFRALRREFGMQARDS